MKVLIIEPQKRPREADILCDYKEMQRIVDGDIACTYPWDDPVGLIHNDNAVAEGKPYNRSLTDENGHVYDIVRGTFIIAGLSEEDFTDLSYVLLQKYKKRFDLPEYFLIRPDGGITILAIDAFSDPD